MPSAAPIAPRRAVTGSKGLESPPESRHGPQRHRVEARSRLERSRSPAEPPDHVCAATCRRPAGGRAVASRERGDRRPCRSAAGRARGHPDERDGSPSPEVWKCGARAPGPSAASATMPPSTLRAIAQQPRLAVSAAGGRGALRGLPAESGGPGASPLREARHQCAAAASATVLHPPDRVSLRRPLAAALRRLPRNDPSRQPRGGAALPGSGTGSQGGDGERPPRSREPAPDAALLTRFAVHLPGRPNVERRADASAGAARPVNAPSEWIGWQIVTPDGERRRLPHAARRGRLYALRGAPPRHAYPVRRQQGPPVAALGGPARPAPRGGPVYLVRRARGPVRAVRRLSGGRSPIRRLRRLTMAREAPAAAPAMFLTVRPARAL